MKKEYLYYSIVVITALAFFKFYFEFFIGLERKHKYIPHIDTEFAPGFTLENWRQIKVGDSMVAIRRVLGKPLVASYERRSSPRPKGCYYEEQYSKDGKWGYADFAWQGFTVYYDDNLCVMALDTTWWYD